MVYDRTRVKAKEFDRARRRRLGPAAVLVLLDFVDGVYTLRQEIAGGWSQPEPFTDPLGGFDGYRIQIADPDLSLLPLLHPNADSDDQAVQYLAINSDVYYIPRRPKRPTSAPYIWNVDLHLTEKQWP